MDQKDLSELRFGTPKKRVQLEQEGHADLVEVASVYGRLWLMLSVGCRCKQKDAGTQRKPRQMSIQRHESVMSRELSDSLQRKKPNSLERWTHNEPKKCEIPRRETKHEQSSIHQMEKMRSQWFMEKQSWTVNDDKVMQRSLQWSRR